MNQNELVIEIYKNPNNFDFLWVALAQTLSFELIEWDYLSNMANMADSADFNDFEVLVKKPNPNIIYSNKQLGYHIQINTRLNIFNQIFAVPDHTQPNRFFVGFVLSTNSTYLKTIGLVVYFNPTGKSTIKSILDNVLFDYDSRNGKPKAYFYAQSLIFVQSHRDTSKLILGLNFLDNNDKVIGTTKKYTSIDSHGVLAGPIQNKNFRFVRVKSENSTEILIDLGSLKIKQEKPNELVICYYQVESGKSTEFIKKFTIDSEPYDDGYPLYCVGCGKLTYVASWIHNTVFMGLGNSYCPNCEIRYSKSDGKWICCKLNSSNRFCSFPVGLDDPCSQPHSTTMTIQPKAYWNKSDKFPFKETIQVTQENIL